VCYDISNLCQTSPTRRLSKIEYEGYGEDMSEGNYGEGNVRGVRGGTGGGSGCGDDDDGAAADDEFASTSSVSECSFSSILKAIAAELTKVLSMNPFAIDLSKATAILAFVGSLIGVIIIGIIYFLRWDKDERHARIYLREEERQKNKDQIAQDSKKGGHGISLKKRKYQQKVS
jgi:hypothetical protein